jgi:hypothetical protein
MSHVDVGNVQRTVQYARGGINGFFRDIGLSISESKSELLIFSRKHTNPSVCVTLQSFNVQTLEVIGRVPPLRLKFSLLNHRYLGLFDWWTSSSTVTCGAIRAESYKDGSAVWHG